MDETLLPDDFRDLGGPLRVELLADGAPVTLELAVEAVNPLPPHRLRAAPFSLLLLGPPKPLLPQATYRLAHPRRGHVEIFLVPVGQDAAATRYEATFN